MPSADRNVSLNQHCPNASICLACICRINLSTSSIGRSPDFNLESPRLDAAPSPADRCRPKSTGPIAQVVPRLLHQTAQATIKTKQTIGPKQSVCKNSRQINQSPKAENSSLRTTDTSFCFTPAQHTRRFGNAKEYDTIQSNRTQLKFFCLRVRTTTSAQCAAAEIQRQLKIKQSAHICLKQLMINARPNHTCLLGTNNLSDDIT